MRTIGKIVLVVAVMAVLLIAGCSESSSPGQADKYAGSVGGGCGVAAGPRNLPDPLFETQSPAESL